MKTNGDEPFERTTSPIVTIAATLLGAAAGSKIADGVIGGRGLPSVLAQIGGALLGGFGGKAIADVIHQDIKDSK
jgi:uncharacterized protein YcfJ